MPSASTSRLRLTPRLARSVGFLPVFFPPEGGLGHAPIHRQPGPVQPLQAIVFQQALLPELEEDAGLDPLLKAVMGGGTGDNPWDLNDISNGPFTDQGFSYNPVNGLYDSGTVTSATNPTSLNPGIDTLTDATKN